MNYDQARAACVNKGAIVRGEMWLVINKVTGEPLQTDATLARAELSAQWCNDHETRNGRPRVYVVQELARGADQLRRDLAAALAERKAAP